MNKVLEFRKEIEDKFRERFDEEMGKFDTIGEGEAFVGDQVFYDDVSDSAIRQYRMNDYLTMTKWEGPVFEKYVAGFEEFMGKIKESIRRAKTKIKDAKIFQQSQSSPFRVLLYGDMNETTDHGVMFAVSFGIVGNA